MQNVGAMVAWVFADRGMGCKQIVRRLGLGKHFTKEILLASAKGILGASRHTPEVVQALGSIADKVSRAVACCLVKL